jgi:lipid A 4'-phosphatase
MTPARMTPSRMPAPAATRAIVALVLAIAVAAVLFVGFPALDLAISQAVYLGERRFWLTDSAFAQAVNRATPKVVWATSVAIILAMAAGVAWRVPGLAFRRMLFLALSFALGPGLVVNGVLKAFWGRARPNDVAEFGGAAQFSPALIPADQCGSNCSFVSGDVAVAFAFVAVALVLPARWRGAGVTAALLLGTGVAALRLMQGAHFLSDVVFAALFTLLPIAVLARLLLAERG